MYNKLQYISQGNTIKKQLYAIHSALDNGCDWIQMRFKNPNVLEVLTLAEAVKKLTQDYTSTFIINDNVQLAKQLDADGVHLGLTDMGIIEARSILGPSKIIGGTANTFEDILRRAAEDCDYIGLGPFQYTTTKQNLSPILGLEGYCDIIEKMRTYCIKIPIYAIGGIDFENIENLMETGIYGIAVSSLITKNKNPSELITQLNEKLYVSI
ncbi:thiamine phosphate synthase [Flavobacterium sp. WC2421]|uniref:thiamine phosphate synthase n=1 Tax=Flavobacterium sp. WC2421 TaxID=3234138 RepID=UPI003465ED94